MIINIIIVIVEIVIYGENLVNLKLTLYAFLHMQFPCRSFMLPIFILVLNS